MCAGAGAEGLDDGTFAAKPVAGANTGNRVDIDATGGICAFPGNVPCARQGDVAGAGAGSECEPPADVRVVISFFDPRSGKSIKWRNSAEGETISDEERGIGRAANIAEGLITSDSARGNSLAAAMPSAPTDRKHLGIP